ncbi:hypothetical protein Hamer_G007575 [Homarus americanus]|uniref:Uncharacterized protein n=1 Tax=Homarus americanus TaxID=6706 RepID=A0A8J5MRE3_HOMAM|nr:hypothetical protein Hamer_G007575 [Homarus americanus]
MNGDFRSGSKALLSEVPICKTPYPPNLQATDLGEETTLILDGQTLVVAIGKRQNARTFGDLADVFNASVLKSGASFSPI